MSGATAEAVEPSLEECVKAKEMVDNLLRHICNVQEACTLLGKRLIDKGEIRFGIQLIAAGQIHDHSKWFGSQWKYLVGKASKNGELNQAIEDHQDVNSHHPDYWDDGVDGMPRIAIAEMVCDLKARSEEQGTSLWDWVKEKAIPRYGIKTQGKFYKQMKEQYEARGY